MEDKELLRSYEGLSHCCNARRYYSGDFTEQTGKDVFFCSKCGETSPHVDGVPNWKPPEKTQKDPPPMTTPEKELCECGHLKKSHYRMYTDENGVHYQGCDGCECVYPHDAPAESRPKKIKK